MTREQLLDILREVKDPELPFIDVVELGVVRDVVIDGGRVRVDITPTYSGCPAIQVIEREVGEALRAQGFEDVEVRTVLTPSWTTDWMSDDTRRKFREHGIAPPGLVAASGGIHELVSIGRAERARKTAECPYCGSSDTTEKSEFGSTACKSIHFCDSCHQPFDSFKAF